MSDDFATLLTQLPDPRYFVRKPGVVVFDAHEERNKAGKLIRKFSKKDLEKIAAQCNKRDATGQLSPLALGHTDPDEKDEEKQPPGVGYARGYAVAYSPRLKKWVIQTSFYIRKEAYPKAKTFPRVSIELWPGKEPIIDPIALLRRTPQRDLGQWTYQKGDPRAPLGVSSHYSRAGKPVLRYSMESQPMAGANPWDDTAAEPAMPEEGIDNPTGEPGSAPTPEEHETYARHCASHPLAMKMAKHYEMQEPAGEEPPPDAAPLMPPDAMDAPMQNRRNGKGGVNQYRKGDPDLYARVEAAEAREAQRVGENWVLRLSDHEGLEMDEDREVSQFARAFRQGGDKACENYADHIRQYHRQKITHPVGRVAGAAPVTRNGARGELDLHEKTLRYQKAHPAMEWEECEAAVKGGK